MKKRSEADRLITKIVVVVTMGALAFGYDTGVIAGACHSCSFAIAKGGLGLTPLTEELVTSALVLGAAFGYLELSLEQARSISSGTWPG